VACADGALLDLQSSLASQSQELQYMCPGAETIMDLLASTLGMYGIGCYTQ
jgi:hypothetical protein